MILLMLSLLKKILQKCRYLYKKILTKFTQNQLGVKFVQSPVRYHPLLMPHRVIAGLRWVLYSRAPIMAVKGATATSPKLPTKIFRISAAT